MRIGIGFHIYALVKNRPLILAGVHIPFELGLQGYSDADVLAHAVADALLGAAGLGDLGKLIAEPQDEPGYSDSMQILQAIERMVHFEKYRIVNIDVVLVLEKPNVLPYKENMQKNLASNLFLRSEQVNIKATSGAGLGLIAGNEGIICYAVALLQER
jgi:2-C-methyl-D-erythritol 2,4-cyclodiphosphate synthase